MNTGVVMKMVAVALSVGVVATGTSCAVHPDSIPLPGNGVSNAYDLTFEFSSAMNLPGRANVMMDGLRVGEVRAINLSGRAVDVAARIEGDTKVPANVTAVIRQNTLLGDTYIDLERNSDQLDAEFLTAGSIVPLSRTSSPPQVEDVMAVLANFVTGGSIQKIQDAISRINRVMPAPPDVAALSRTVSVDLQDLSRNTDVVDRMLGGLNETAVSVADQGADLSVLFGDSGAIYWRRLSNNVLKYIGILLPSIGSIFEGGFWLVPLLDSMASASGSVRATLEDVPADAETAANFLNRTLVPFLKKPSLDVTSVQTQQGDDLTGGIANLLRILGAAK
ncbi:hypothetical protein B7C42_03111 [Nocardia cerradoensis]|uniref:Mce/MlaD domain-containing protein n=1 Tax=Nocardia cerradoensis TaxID=85688 RepID=A0A231H887_9NOCA|nr:MlaD family protein [Nocardia cerradoensis]OXR45154.1 hypothetical protein B7C42_03111 [Nocardia cerradoensis]